jgi:predicted Zn-dependent protease
MPSRLEALEMMVSREPNDPFPYYGLALEYRSAGRLEDCLDGFRKLRAKFPDYVPMYLMAAQVSQETGAIDDARRWCRDGIDAAGRKRDGHAAGELESLLAGLPE